MTLRRPADDGTLRTTYTAAGLELLDRHGPASQTLSVDAPAFTEMTGLHRSAIYRYWETIDELNRDLAILLATAPTSWQGRLVAQPPEAPLAVTLAEALRTPLVEVTVFARSYVAGWRSDHPVRPAVVAHSRAELDRLGDWLAIHLAAHGRRPVHGTGADDLAVTLAAVVDGNRLMWLASTDLSQPRWTASERQALVHRVLRVLGERTEPGRRLGVPARLDPLRAPERTRPQQFLHDALVDLPVSPFARWRPTPVRLVQVGRLARRLGVHERRLYAMWPTASEMNADLAVAVFRRSQQRVEALLHQMFDEGSVTSATSLDELVVTCSQAGVEFPFRYGDANYFALTQAMGDPTVRAAADAVVDGWVRDLRTAFLAGQALTTWTRRPDVTADEYAVGMRESTVGVQLLTAFHPELLERRIVLDGADRPLAGTIPLLLARSTSYRSPAAAGDHASPDVGAAATS